MIMEDELFNNITWDKDSQWSGTMTLANRKTVAFEIDGFEPIESIPEAALNTLKFLIANEPLIRHKIAVSMKEHFNETWLYESTITPEELAQKIKLDNVSILDEGGGYLRYEADDNLFTDHCIQVLIDANGEIDTPSLEG
jgi:hypothetical protein